MRITFAIPRYGAGIVGGAEAQVGEYARRLVARGHEVAVLATCVVDHFRWTNDLPAGTTEEHGVTVTRFPVEPRDHELMARLQFALDSGLTLPEPLEREWVANSGRSEAMLDALDAAAARSDALVLCQYLFAPAALGASRIPGRALLLPFLHDEAYARFSCVRRAIHDARGLLLNTHAERDLAQHLYGTLPRHAVVGAGVELPHKPPDAAAWRARRGIDGDVVAYAGRREAAKNYPLLAEAVVAVNRGLDGERPLTLVSMGGGDAGLPRSAVAHVRDLGRVAEDEKLAAFAAATAVANLSLNESFSFVLMEGWSVGTPAIVHSGCAVTRRHCEDSGGGLWVSSVEEFAAAVTRLRHDASLRRAMGEAGRRYVEARYTWDAVIERLERAITELAA